MDNVASLLDLPTETLIALAGGYVGYRIWSTGKDGTHGAMDVAFGSLVFAMICRLGAAGLAAADAPEAIQAAAGMVVAVVAAAGWRKWGERLMSGVLRRIGISISDRHVTAWDPLRVNPNLRPSQIIVRRKDGTQLMCDQLERFAAFPAGPCRFGADGSVALYVTDTLSPGDQDWEPQDVTGPDDWGNLMTYVPAVEVAQLMVRY